MSKYNYLEAITNDIECWMDKDEDPFDISQFEDKDEAAEYLNNELWAEDSITGNGPYGYADEYTCEEYLCHNLDIVIEAMSEMDVLSDPFRFRNYIDKGSLARYLDCMIRCYLLSQAIDKALEIWEDYGNKYKNKAV